MEACGGGAGGGEEIDMDDRDPLRSYGAGAEGAGGGRLGGASGTEGRDVSLRFVSSCETIDSRSAFLGST